MNIKQLKELIANLPDDMVVVSPGSDHSYDEARAYVTDAEILRSRTGKHIEYMWEYYDEGNRSTRKSVVEDVLVVSTL